jgi:hypothetical protein
LTADRGEARNLVKDNHSWQRLLRDKVRGYRAGEP